MKEVTNSDLTQEISALPHPAAERRRERSQKVSQCRLLTRHSIEKYRLHLNSLHFHYTREKVDVYSCTVIKEFSKLRWKMEIGVDSSLIDS